jgi:hypothetical protein
MRALVVGGLLMVAGAAYAQEAPAPEDDPKLERPAPVVAAAPLGDEDDPKLARGAVTRRKLKLDHYVPRVKLAYRRLTFAGLDSDTIDFNTIELDYYPFSSWVRLGIDTEIGIGSDKYSSWFFTVGGTLGLQYPWRVTPFIDGRFVAGLIGGSYLGQTAVSWVYVGGIDIGCEFYTVGRLLVTAAIGWAHPVFSGIDAAYVRAHPMLEPQRKELSYDTFTFKIGIGL